MGLPAEHSPTPARCLLPAAHLQQTAVGSEPWRAALVPLSRGSWGRPTLRAASAGHGVHVPAGCWGFGSSAHFHGDCAALQRTGLQSWGPGAWGATGTARPSTRAGLQWPRPAAVGMTGAGRRPREPSCPPGGRSAALLWCSVSGAQQPFVSPTEEARRASLQRGALRLSPGCPAAPGPACLLPFVFCFRAIRDMYLSPCSHNAAVPARLP